MNNRLPVGDALQPLREGTSGKPTHAARKQRLICTCCGSASISPGGMPLLTVPTASPSAVSCGVMRIGGKNARVSRLQPQLLWRNAALPAVSDRWQKKEAWAARAPAALGQPPPPRS